MAIGRRTSGVRAVSGLALTLGRANGTAKRSALARRVVVRINDDRASRSTEGYNVSDMSVKVEETAAKEAAISLLTSSWSL